MVSCGQTSNAGDALCNAANPSAVRERSRQSRSPSGPLTVTRYVPAETVPAYTGSLPSKVPPPSVPATTEPALTRCHPNPSGPVPSAATFSATLPAPSLTGAATKIRGTSNTCNCALPLSVRLTSRPPLVFQISTSYHAESNNLGYAMNNSARLLSGVSSGTPLRRHW